MQDSVKDPGNIPRLSARIDLLRGLFAVWVFFAHSYGLFVKLRPEPVPPGIVGWIERLLTSGYIGVTGFFFLSGFCIHWSIAKHLERSERFPLRGYLKNRFWRIAPLFYTALLLTVLLEWITGAYLQRAPMWPMPAEAGRVLAGSLFFLQGLTVGYGSYQPAWSITNEVIYYLAWPLCLFLAGFRVFRAAALAAVAGLVLTGAFYILWRKTGGGENIFLIGLWMIPMASFMWTLGAVCRAGHGRITGNKIFARLSPWWLPVFVLWLCWTTTLNVLNLSLFLRTVLDPLVWVAVPLLVLSDWRVTISAKALRWLADLSYPLYLLHGPLLIFFASLLETVYPGASPVVVVLVSSAAAFAVSASIGVALERYFLGLRKNLT